MTAKSTVDQIRTRFDSDVDRFSDIKVGQASAIDSAICLDLISQGAARLCPSATTLLDIGCGAGNWSLKLLEAIPKLTITLVDLSQPMLDRAIERVQKAGGTTVDCKQADVRSCRYKLGSFDLIVAGSVLHHLRESEEWVTVFKQFHRWLKPGGSVWVYDLVSQEHPAIASMMNARYSDYLRKSGGDEYVKKVFDYIAEEDSPMPVTWQLDKLREAGFTTVDLLHKSANFAAYCAVR